MSNGNIILVKTGAGQDTPVPTVHLYEWGISAPDVNEGGTVTPTITLNRNGAPVPFGEVVYCDFMFDNVPVLPVIPVAGGTDFTVGQSTAIQNGITTYNAAHPTTLASMTALGGTPARYRISFTATGNISFPFSRPVAASLSEDKQTLPTIAAVSQGAILTAQAVVTMNDISVPVAQGVGSFDQAEPVSGVSLTYTFPTCIPVATSWAFNWQKAGVDISGASGTTSASTVSRAPIAGEIGSTLRMRATPTGADGAGAQILSGATSAVVAAPVGATPANTVAPAWATLFPTQGVPLDGGVGTWDNSPTSFTVKLYRGPAHATLISTTTYPASTPFPYTPVGADAGLVLTIGVVATNGFSSSAEVFSTPTNAVAATGATLVDIFLGTSPTQYPAGPSIAVGAASGTNMSAGATPLKGLLSNGTIVTLDSVGFITGGDEGGRFAFSGANLIAGLVSPDFEGPSQNNGFGFFFTLGHPYYNPTLTGTYGGVTVTKQFRIRQKVKAVNTTTVTGAGASPSSTVVITNTGNVQADFGTFANALVQNPGLSGRFIDLTGYVGVIEANTGNGINGKKNNFTLEANRNCVLVKDNTPYISGDNLLIRNCAFRPGADLVGRFREDRDAAAVTDAHDVLVVYCSFTWSIDEVFSIISIGNARPIRNCRITYCLIAEPLWQSGHDSTEPSHPYGLLLYYYSINLVVDKNFFNGFVQRSPAMRGHMCATTIQNNIMANFGLNQFNGAIGFYADWEGNNSTAIVRANLLLLNLDNASSTAASKAHALVFSKLNSTDDIYIPTTGSYPNRFFSKPGGGGPVFGEIVDPMVHSTVGGNLAENYDRSNWLSSDPPYDMDSDYGIMETATDVGCLALYNEILENCGVGLLDGSKVRVPGDLNGSQIDYDIKQQFRASQSAARKPTGGFPLGKWLDADYNPALVTSYVATYDTSNPP